jgi:hypothetical protein
MTRPAEDDTKGASQAEFRRLIVQLGIAMVAAGEAVDIIEESLRRIVAAYGVTGLQIALLPTSMFVQTGAGDRAHVQFSSQVAPALRLDQIDGLYRLVRQLERAELTVGALPVWATSNRSPMSRCLACYPFKIRVFCWSNSAWVSTPADSSSPSCFSWVSRSPISGG